MQFLVHLSVNSTAREHRVAEYQLQLVSEAEFAQADEQSSTVVLQQLRQSQHGHDGLHSMAELLCGSAGQPWVDTDGSMRDAAVKPFVPLPLTALQPKIKVSRHTHGWLSYAATPPCCMPTQLHCILASRLAACSSNIHTPRHVTLVAM